MSSNDEYQHQSFNKMNFKKEDIKGYTMIDGRKVTVLKEGVRCKNLNLIQDPNKLEQHINQELIDYTSYEYFYKVILGLDNWEYDPSN